MNILELAERVAEINGIAIEAAEDAIQNLIEQIESLEQREIDTDEISKDDAEFIAESVRQMRRNGELGEKELDELAEQIQVLEDAKERVQLEQKHRDDMIRKALKAGAKIKDVMAVSGLSRQSINLISRSL